MLIVVITLEVEKSFVVVLVVVKSMVVKNITTTSGEFSLKQHKLLVVEVALIVEVNSVVVLVVVALRRYYDYIYNIAITTTIISGSRCCRTASFRR